MGWIPLCLFLENWNVKQTQLHVVFPARRLLLLVEIGLRVKNAEEGMTAGKLQNLNELAYEVEGRVDIDKVLLLARHLLHCEVNSRKEVDFPDLTAEEGVVGGGELFIVWVFAFHQFEIVLPFVWERFATLEGLSSSHIWCFPDSFDYSGEFDSWFKKSLPWHAPCSWPQRSPSQYPRNRNVAWLFPQMTKISFWRSTSSSKGSTSSRFKKAIEWSFTTQKLTKKRPSRSTREPLEGSSNLPKVTQLLLRCRLPTLLQNSPHLVQEGQ